MNVSIARLNELLSVDSSGTLAFNVPRKGRRADGVVGSLRSDGYVRVKVDGVSLFAHQIVFALVHGKWPKAVDHINGIRSDNRPSNLRECTPSENLGNMRISSRNTSGYKGVSWSSATAKWYACIQVHGRSKNLGYYATKEEAADAYLKAATEVFGDFARAA